jgi:putative ABC transport system permease protein
MLGFAWHSARGRPRSSLAIILALLAASLSLSMLGVIGAKAQVELVGDIERAWSTPYDILVRPEGTLTPLEAAEGLVRPNFVSGLRGGITDAQLAAIRSDPDVEVAAPIAMAGFVNWPLALVLPLAGSTSGEQVRLYRITTSISGDAGLSTFPVEQRLVVSASAGQYQFAGRLLQVGDTSIPCPVGTDCFAGTACHDSECEEGGFPAADDARYYLPLLIPVAIAGIDPVAEAQLAGLDRCVSDGRYLTADDRPVEVGDPEEQLESLPVLLSQRSFVEQQVHVEIAQATVGSEGLDAQNVDPSVWSPMDRETFSIEDLYRSYIPSVHDYLDPWPIWSTSDVTYDQLGDRELRALPTAGEDPFATAPLSSEYGISDQLLEPPEASDVGFRRVSVHADRYRPGPGSAFRWKLWNVIGQYDAECLPGFDPLAGGSLETYSYPAVVTSDGRTLTPSRSLTGYVNAPPLVLTTLEGAAWLSDDRRFAGQPGEAYISAIRLRIRDVGPASTAAYERLLAIASRIADKTHLRLDVVKGGSPTSVRVELAAGDFGRPALSVVEGWSLKGSAVRIREAVSEQDLAIGLLSVMLGLLLAYATSAAAMAARAPETQTLLDIGWPRSSVRRALVAEHLLLGGVAGAIAASMTAASVVLLSPGTGPAPAIAAGLLPVATAVSVAFLSTGNAATGAFPRHRPRQRVIRRLAGFALEELISRPAPALLMVLGIALAGLAAGSTAVIALAFHGRLDSSALGSHISLVSGWFEWAISAVATTCAGAAVLQMQRLLFLRQRRPLATLIAIGWPASLVRWYVCLQATYAGAAGGAVAGIGVIVLAAAMGSVAVGLLVAGGLFIVSAGFAAAIAARVVASLGPRALANDLREES